jgi:hypothetical protein
VSFANTYLIDGDLFEFVEPGMSKPSDETSFLDIFDDVPADSQMPSHILDSHMF